MISKALAFGLLAVGCVVAAAGGAFVAVRQNVAPGPAVSAPAAQPPTVQSESGKAVSETEAIVALKAEEVPEPAPLELAPRPTERARGRRTEAAPTPRATRTVTPAPVPAPPPVPATPERSSAAVEAPVATPVPAADNAPEPARTYEPPAVVEPQFEEVIVPASSVIGLQVTTALSSERTQVEDRVDARVTRDVLSAGRVAIPAGSRVIGSVTLVERGGKVKERARLGVRFHTLVLADGSELALRTEGIFREGDAPSGESARKIGGAAVGGAILGAILGGGKGAAIGGATGAAGGTAAVMSGGRNPATLSSGTVVNVRLTAPLAVELRTDK